MKRWLAIVAAVLLGAGMPWAQPVDPVRWTAKVVEVDAASADLLFTADIAAGWHLYSQHTDPAGPQPTTFGFVPGSACRLVGRVEESPAPQEEMDDMFGCVVKSFAGRAVFRQRVERMSGDDVELKATVTYQLCGNGMCVAPDDREFVLTVPGRRTGGETAAPAGTKPRGGAELVADTAGVALEAAVADSAVAPVVEESPAKPAPHRRSWLVYFLLAVGGGVLTMFTPCVFPMIPMTVNYFLRGGDNRRRGRRQAWFFGLSIVLIFAVLGGVLAAIFGPEQLNAVATHWVPNLLFFIVFLLFSLSFFGLFELKMPSRWVNSADSRADKGGFMAPFFIALTTVLVSFSCTGPIIGGALAGLTSAAGSAHAGRWVSLVSMLGFGVGFALPFTSLAMFPQMLKGMKSGAWLNTVKVSFAFLELAFGLKFLQMADIDAGWGLLPRDIYLALWIVIFGLWGVYLLGGLRLKGDAGTAEGIGVGRLMVALADLAFVVYMVPGLWGAELKELSGFLPPMSSQQFVVGGHVPSGTAVQALPADRRYVGQLAKYTPAGYAAFYDLEEATAYARKVGKPLFVEFTGKNCANCREMEHYVWSDAEVRRLLTEEYVVCSLFTDENSIVLPEAEWTSDDRGRILKTLGRKNSYYQRKVYNMNAQPYYVAIDADGHRLTEANYQYDRDVRHFVAWLEEGLKNTGK